MDPRHLRAELRSGSSANLRRRRGIVFSSLAGMAATAAVTLLQTGALHHLPDLPFGGFDTDKVSLSDRAYRLGAPDGTIGLLAFAMDVPLAALGGAGRAESCPWIPLAALAKAAVGAAVAAWYLYHQPAEEHAWCSYCLAGELASAVTLALTLPEARQALRALRHP